MEILPPIKYRENMTFLEALRFLRSNPDGTISHPTMEDLDFLFFRDDGSLAFCDMQPNQEVEVITDLEEFSPENGWDSTWYYLPAYEFSFLKEGEEIWDEIRRVEPDPLALPKP